MLMQGEPNSAVSLHRLIATKEILCNLGKNAFLYN